ncbi:hypothetical protein COB87_000535 [Candidatus Wolfebacteria bacterium]|nr:hypothetical protein [Candidatus Wolfebacteria bacterium]
MRTLVRIKIFEGVIKMDLTKEGRGRRNKRLLAAQNVSTDAEAIALWNEEDRPQIVQWTRVYLIKNSKVWGAIKPLYVNCIDLADIGPDALLQNIALTDRELVELGVVTQNPHGVLKHPNCGDFTRKRVEEIHKNGNAAIC